jgi:hypothetical protein
VQSGDPIAVAGVAIVLLTIGFAVMSSFLVRAVLKLYYLLSRSISRTVSQSLDKVNHVTAQR